MTKQPSRLDSLKKLGLLLLGVVTVTFLLITLLGILISPVAQDIDKYLNEYEAEQKAEKERDDELKKLQKEELELKIKQLKENQKKEH